MSKNNHDMLGRCVAALTRVPENSLGLILDVVQKLAGKDGASYHRHIAAALRQTPLPRWREENGVIYFTVTSDGTTGEEWITRLKKKGVRVSDYAKSILRSPEFKPTNGVTSEIGVLKGELFSDDERITKKIRADADKRKFTKPNAELACLIRDMFTDEEIEAMGLWWIIAMHDPIKDSGGDPRLLCTSRDGLDRWLDTCYDKPRGRWDRESGFAFVVS